MPAPKAFLNLNAGAWRSVQSRHRDCAVSPAAALRYRMTGAWLSGLERIAGGLAAPPAEMAEAPIFVVGHWRSGTTLLHELLCALPSHAYPTTYACMNPQVFGATERAQLAKAKRVVSRPMDTMTIGPGSPQEDEFALLLLGAVSPYEHLLFPEALPDIPRLSDVARLDPVAREDWERIFRTFLGRVSALNPGRRIVLKSPSHSFRIALLASMFPKAKFLRIVRRPDHVLASTIRLWRSLWALYALCEQPGEEGLTRSCADTMAALHAAMEAELAALPSANAATVSFDGLIADPAGTMQRIGQSLELPELESMPETLRSRIGEMRTYRARDAALTEPQWRAVRSTIEPLAEDYCRIHEACG